MTIERYNYNDEPSGRSETLVQSIEKIYVAYLNGNGVVCGG